MPDKNLIEVSHVKKSFVIGDKQELLVLEDIHFRLAEGEIVAILGKSGCGKSTLLRIIAGLISPTSGTVKIKNEIATGPMPGISMVFQHFALMPWLTVLQNVELGLEAQGVPKNTRRSRAIKAIDTIGLDGFESALPKELSGGMRQRVGLARALVVDPDILLMDEPFSALDVLTADSLIKDLLNLWHRKKTKIKGILFVTHNIEEAVYMADRVVVIDGDPGTIRSELVVKLPYPRQNQSPEFHTLVDQVYKLMTTQKIKADIYGVTEDGKHIDLGYRLPEASVEELTGLLEMLNTPEHKGKMDLPEIADLLTLDIDDLFPLTEALEILHFATVSEGDITITEEGIHFEKARILNRKKIFSAHLKKHVPLARHIHESLLRRPSHRSAEEKFLSLLEDYLTEKEAERVLKTVIEWGRYAELFAYDYHTGVLSLENSKT